MNITTTQMTDLLNMVQSQKVTAKGEEDETLQETCADFEGVLLNYMFQSMKSTVGDSGLFEDDFQGKMYESLYIEKISEKIADERSLGLGESLYRQLASRMYTEGGGDSSEGQGE